MKSQTTNYKLQKGFNNQNSKLCLFGIGFCDFLAVCNLQFVI